MIDIERKEHVIDAEGIALGRLASEIAVILQGKNKPSYQAHADCGDIVKVQNVGKIKLTGKKDVQKMYHHYSGYPSGIKSVSLRDMKANKPAELLRNTVRLMLPNNKLRTPSLKRLIIE